MSGFRRRTRLFVKLAASILSVALVLSLAEWATRRTRPDLTTGIDERVLFCEYDPELGWRNRPSVDGTFFGTQVTHNSGGQRDRQRYADEAERWLRVMVVGDSFVWGYRVAAADRFTDRLEKRLPGSDVMNFGCSGYGQDQEYLLLRREMARYSPDVVVVGVHVASDLENDVNSFQYGYYKPLFSLEGDELVVGNVPVPHDSLGTRVNRWMTGRSALWNLLGERTVAGVTVRVHFINALNAVAGDATAKPVRSKTPRAQMACRLCAAINDLVAAAGARTLMLLIPDTDVHDQISHVMPEYDQLLDCLAERSVPVLDLDRVFREYHAAHPKASITLNGDRHWSPLGHEVVSRALADYLLSHPDPAGASGN